jgi:hypothetical protein
MLVPLALLAPLLAPVAEAQLTAFWQRVPITPAAIAEDPTLAGMQSWDLKVTANGNWASAGLRAVLPDALTFYNHLSAATPGRIQRSSRCFPLWPSTPM